MFEFIELNPVFEKLWQNLDPFDAINHLEGEVFRHVKKRQTFRFELDGKGYFAKIHHGVGWKEIFKNLLQFKRPILGARNEFMALKHLHQLGVDTMTVCAFGERGFNPAQRESFIVTAELENMISLEDLAREWTANPPPFRIKLGLLRRLAMITGDMHQSGMTHRDCYLCHFLTRRNELDYPLPRLFVIDLHRARIWSQVPRHYLIKDVAGLFFSAMDTCITRHDLLRFIKIYTGNSLREALAQDQAFWHAVDRTARKLYRKEFQRQPPKF